MPKPKGKPKAKPSRIFSGRSSDTQWRWINRTRAEEPSAWDYWLALYAIGAVCRELEERVERLERSQPPDPVIG